MGKDYDNCAARSAARCRPANACCATPPGQAVPRLAQRHDASDDLAAGVHAAAALVSHTRLALPSARLLLLRGRFVAPIAPVLGLLSVVRGQPVARSRPPLRLAITSFDLKSAPPSDAHRARAHLGSSAARVGATSGDRRLRSQAAAEQVESRGSVIHQRYCGSTLRGFVSRESLRPSRPCMRDPAPAPCLIRVSVEQPKRQAALGTKRRAMSRHLGSRRRFRKRAADVLAESQRGNRRRVSVRRRPK